MSSYPMRVTNQYKGNTSHNVQTLLLLLWFPNTKAIQVDSLRCNYIVVA